MITRIRNANLIKANKVYVPKTDLTFSIAKILEEEGFVRYVECVNNYEALNRQDICIYLKFSGLARKPYITSLKRVSKPGLRVYVNVSNLPRVLNGVGLAVLSTSRGLMTDRVARLKNLGGEVLFYIW